MSSTLERVKKSHASSGITGQQSQSQPSGVKAFVRARPVLVYFAIAFLLAWGGAFLIGAFGPGSVPATAEQYRPYLFYAMLLGFAAPALSGIVVTTLTEGTVGLRSLRQRLGHWRVGVQWYAVALLTAPVAVLGVLLLLSRMSTDFLPAVFTTDSPVVLLLIGTGAGAAAGFLEELGWTGFAVPRLRSRHGVVATGLLVGFVWGVWHLSYFVMRGTPDGGVDLRLFVPEVVGMFLVVLPAYRVLLVWLYDRTGSLPVTMAMHASLSATTAVILAPDVTGTSLAVYYLSLGALLCAVAGAVLWVDHRRNRSVVSTQVKTGRS